MTIEPETITYTTQKLSFFKRFWITNHFPPSKNKQLQQITFCGDNVTITMRSGKTYELKAGEYKTSETILGIAEDNYNIKITTLGKPKLKINICGFDGELTPEEWKDIKTRLGYTENEHVRKSLKKAVDIAGEFF